MGELTHIKEHIGKLMEKVEWNMRKCNCSMAISVLGDGCPVCQPETWEEMLRLQMEECRQDWREDIAIGMNHPDKHFSVWHGTGSGDWDMLADYFSHE